MTVQTAISADLWIGWTAQVPDQALHFELVRGLYSATSTPKAISVRPLRRSSSSPPPAG